MTDMKGIINYYLYIPEGSNMESQTIIDLFYKVNQAVFDKVTREAGYHICVVPTNVKEACRIEKLDFDKAFPRFAAKSHIDLAVEDRRKSIREQERLEMKQKRVED